MIFYDHSKVNKKIITWIGSNDRKQKSSKNNIGLSFYGGIVELNIFTFFLSSLEMENRY